MSERQYVASKVCYRLHNLQGMILLVTCINGYIRLYRPLVPLAVDRLLPLSVIPHISPEEFLRRFYRADQKSLRKETCLSELLGQNMLFWILSSMKMCLSKLLN